MTIKKKKHVYKAGDRVRIVNPELFVRCGYPLTFDDAKAFFEYDKEKMESIRNFVAQICGNKDPHKIKHYNMDRIVSALAYTKVKLEGFGGLERTIYTKRKEEFLNKEYIVHDKFVVRTGTYYGPSNSYTYSPWYGSEEDYEPGGLDNIQSHVILKLAEPDCWFVETDTPAIEEKHVEPVSD